MTKSLYIAATEPNCGKSLVVLGIMEMLSRRVDHLGFFRPIVRSSTPEDSHIKLVRSRYALAATDHPLYAFEHGEATRIVQQQSLRDLLQRILESYRRVEPTCDFVVCEGTDFTGVSTAFEFDFNAHVANHLGCPVLIITDGNHELVADIVNGARTAREGFAEMGCTIAATIVNRVRPGLVAEVRRQFQQTWKSDDPVYAIPERDILSKPTLREIATALDADYLYQGDDGPNRIVADYKVAAMHIPDFLKHVNDGTLVITPGDRADVLLASLLAVRATTFPHIAGIVLTGDIQPAPLVRKLIDGLQQMPIPIIAASGDTFDVAMRINQVPAILMPENHRKIATALGAFESGVDLSALEKRIEIVRSSRVTPLMFEYELVERAKRKRQHIVLPEGTDSRILRAVEILLSRNVADITLLGNETEIRDRIGALNLDLETVRIVDPAQSSWLATFTSEFVKLRRHKGVTEDQARDVMHAPTYFGTMMVWQGIADGMVSGATHTTANTIRPAFQIIRSRPGISSVSSAFLMCLADRVLVYADCAVIPRPTAEQLADIAISSASTAAMFDIEPRIAMLSYSTGQSGHGSDVDKVREATALVRQREPNLLVDGPMQYDAAVALDVGNQKLPGSLVAGRATVFIFPDLNTGNNTYKAVQRTAGAVAIGPVLQGLNKPVNDLSRGCTVTDIVNTIAITAIQARMGKTLDA